jgi:hypothetical protein
MPFAYSSMKDYIIVNNVTELFLRSMGGEDDDTGKRLCPLGIINAAEDAGRTEYPSELMYVVPEDLA